MRGVSPSATIRRELSIRTPRPNTRIAVNQPDAELIAASLSGQTDAFGVLVVRYQNRLYNTLVHTLGSAEDAHDVAQDAFSRAFQKLATFEGRCAFYSWLFRIAHHCAVNHRRRNWRSTASLDAAREQAGNDPADPSDFSRPDHDLEVSERQVMVRTALQRLPDEYRTILVLREIDGLNYEEIADAIDCPIGTVRSRIHRARLELRSKLEVMLKSS